MSAPDSSDDPPRHTVREGNRAADAERSRGTVDVKAQRRSTDPESIAMALAAIVGFIVGFVLSGGQGFPMLARLAIATGTAVGALTLAGALLSGSDD